MKPKNKNTIKPKSKGKKKVRSKKGQSSGTQSPKPPGSDERKKNKIILDFVHGYIDVCPDIEKIINHASFQRLKDIRQMTAQHLYPSANHTRFEHSLGVMHLGIQFFDSLRDQLKDKLKKDNNCENVEKRIDFLYFHLCYAALLHDIGHAPFSHLGEKFYKFYENNKNNKNNKIKETIKQMIGNNGNSGITCKLIDECNNGSSHEWMGCYVILKNFTEVLANIADNQNTVELDLEFIIRIITGNVYGDNLWDRNIIINIVNSDTLDVDKLDYIMRDNIMVGKIGPEIDLRRIVESLCITGSPEKLMFTKVGLSAIQKVVDCRDQIYLWVCNHHTVVYTDFLFYEMLSKCIKLKDKTSPPLCIDKSTYDKLSKQKKYYEHVDTDIYKLVLGRFLNEAVIEEIYSVLNDNGVVSFAEEMEFKDYFSPDAIAENKVSDSDICAFFKNAVIKNKDTVSLYTAKLFKQLFERDYLKPLWKTIFEYETFMRSIGNASARDAFVSNLKDEENGEKFRSDVVKKIICDVDCAPGDVFLIRRDNKFYGNDTLKNIYIHFDDEHNKPLTEILPQKQYDKGFEETAFYVFCRKGKEDDVKKRLIAIIGKPNIINAAVQPKGSAN